MLLQQTSQHNDSLPPRPGAPNEPDPLAQNSKEQQSQKEPPRVPSGAADLDDIYDNVADSMPELTQTSSYETPGQVHFREKTKPPAPADPPPIYDNVADMDYEEI